MMDSLLFLLPAITMAALLVGIHVYLGLHVIQRDVIFVDISLSQVAALGGALALLIGAEENVGLSMGMSLGLCWLVAMMLATVRHLENKISQEAVIGITYALANGILILVVDGLPHGAEHLKAALIGDILFVTWNQVLVTAAIYAIVGFFHFLFRRQFWEVTLGQRKSIWWDFLFYFLFGVVITFSTHHAGVLVVFSILVVPAALVSGLVSGFKARLLCAWAFGWAAMALAFALSVRMDWPAGATIVTTLTGTFFVILTCRMLKKIAGGGIANA
jgi:zinc/manganese transport system permease protein